MALPGPTESCPDCRRRDRELADSHRSMTQQPGARVSADLELYMRVDIPWTQDAVSTRLHEWRALSREGPARQVRATDLPRLHYPNVTPQSADFPPRVVTWYDGIRTGPVSS